MAFTVEDGTVTEDANSYVSVEDFDTYLADRGTTLSGATGATLTSLKEQALVRATDYIEQVYYDLWAGELVDEDQELAWPRYIENADSDDIPKRLKNAVCILATEALTEDLNPAQTQSVKREKIDVIEIEYQENSSSIKRRPAIDGLLQKYLFSGPFNGKVTRV